jgi:nicotinate-nucleotide adenylyltransferase
MKIGLLFGSFNPVHYGHLLIAEYFVSQTDIDNIWFVVSPKNPLKSEKDLMDENHRLNMVKLAIRDNKNFDAIDIEFQMPRPSYTIDTLTKLSLLYPSDELIILIGTDSLVDFHKWKDFKIILNNYKIYVYPRKDYKPEKSFNNYPNLKYFNAPEVDISSTDIRKNLSKSFSLRYLTPDVVINYLKTI